MIIGDEQGTGYAAFYSSIGHDASNVERKSLGIRSAQGISVCNSVKRKLQGTDQSDTEALPVTVQVNNLIEEARNVDNLALMYEGWTAWV
ncbi:FATC domain protein [Trichuris suis]|nr:FATC domain protein [Trichuris suis]